MQDFTSFYNHLTESKVESNTLTKINNAIEQAGGEIYVVGGPIRDFILGHDPKDIDFLVRKLTLKQIEEALSTIGKPKEVGRDFGIVKAHIDHEEFDFAIPRTKETQTGDKHTDFTVTVDPNASVQDDLKRRDFTWNAMAVPLKVFVTVQGYPKEKAIELLRQAVIDPNGGLSDLDNKILRAVGDPKARFSEDPLRILRALQFATRMGFDITGKTAEAIKELAPLLHNVSGERVFEEFKKAWTKGRADSETFVKLLWKLDIGFELFGNKFNPYVLDLSFLTNPEEKIAGQFIAFFLNGGDFEIMKPDSKYVKLLEVARLIEKTEEYPYTYSGNLTESDFHVLAALFHQIDPKIFEKISKMMKTPLKGKSLAVDGPGLAQILGITDRKDFPKIGTAQKAVLQAIWDNKIQNNAKEIHDFLKSNPITEEYFKPKVLPKEKASFTCEEEISEEVSSIIEAFIEHALTFLRLSDKPPIVFLTVRREGMTHGCFSPTTKEILVYIKGRSLADYLRTLAHELVHFHQRKTGKIEDGHKYPEIGGEIEDEANSVGGQIIKSFGKTHKKVYDL